MKKYTLILILVASIIIVPQITHAGILEDLMRQVISLQQRIVQLLTNRQVVTVATTTGQVVCTMEAKQCPDGSYVGRQGSKCEFKACPAPTSSSNKVVEKLCHLKAGRTYEVRLCGNYYNVFEPNLMDAPTHYYDITGKFEGDCGGMPGPDGTSFDDPVCDVSMRCSDVDLCK